MPSRSTANGRRLIACCGIAVASLGLIVSRPQARDVQLVSREVLLMGTAAVLSTWSESRPAGLARIERLLEQLEHTEAQLSTWREDSEASRLNASAGSAPVRLSAPMCELARALEHWTRDTGGAFDPALGALTSAWDIHGRGKVPSPAQLDTALAKSGWHRVMFDSQGCTLAMPAGMSIDVGGFGKGEALDRARAALAGTAPWLIDLGGQVAVSGAPAGTSGWDVSIAHPRRRHRPVLRIRMSDGSLATSAGSERSLRIGGRTIGHILDPRTGRPATFTGSVTVWHEQALAADVLSTALFVMGPEEGLAWADARRIAALYLIPDKKGAVVSRASLAFQARFSPSTLAP